MITEISPIEITAVEMPPKGISESIGELELGKFKSAEALLDAYNNLEKEFTRRSQSLKEMERKLSEINPLTQQKSDDIENIAIVKSINSTGDVVDDKQPECELYSDVPTNDAHSVGREINVSDKAQTDIKSPSVSDLIAMLLEDKGIKEQLYNKLLDDLSSANLPNMAGRKGQMLLTPVKKPKDIAEAGRIAQELIKSRRI